MKNSLIKAFGSDYENHLEIISVKHSFRKMLSLNSINPFGPTLLPFFTSTALY